MFRKCAESLGSPSLPSSADPLVLIENTSSRHSSHAPSAFPTYVEEDTKIKRGSSISAQTSVGGCEDEVTVNHGRERKRRRICSDDHNEEEAGHLIITEEVKEADSSIGDESGELQIMPPASHAATTMDNLVPSTSLIDARTLTPKVNITGLVPPGHLPDGDSPLESIAYEQVNELPEILIPAGLPTPPVTSVVALPVNKSTVSEESAFGREGVAGAPVEVEPSLSLGDEGAFDDPSTIKGNVDSLTAQTRQGEEPKSVEAITTAEDRGRGPPTPPDTSMMISPRFVLDGREASEREMHPDPPTSTPAMDEGEEEIDPDEARDMDVDASSEGSPAPTDAIMAVANSTQTAFQKSKAKALKAKVGAKVGNKKKHQAKQSVPIKKGGQVASKTKAKTKVNGLKSEGSKNRSVSVSDSVQASASAVSSDLPTHREESVDPGDTAIYCVCLKPYNEEDEDVVMVGCDACDNWFHPGCIGLSVDKLDLLDVYICKSCERTTAQRTLYKVVCKRDDCLKSVAGLKSKFCSSGCAFRHSHATISAMINKKTIKQLAGALIAYPPPAASINVINHIVSPDPPLSAPSPDLISILQHQIQTTEAAIGVIQKRQRILQQAIKHCEDLTATVMTVNGDDGTSKKMTKGTNSNADNRPCGWEKRLIWDDQEIESWDGEEVEGESCLLPRRRCDRHQGWQKTMTVSIDVEAAQLNRRHQDLIAQRNVISNANDLNITSLRLRDTFKAKMALRIPQAGAG